MRRKEGIVLFRKLLWCYELVSVSVTCFGRSNGCYGLSVKLCIYTFLLHFVVVDRADLLVHARGERRDHCCLYGGFRITVVRGRRGVWS